MAVWMARGFFGSVGGLALLSVADSLRALLGEARGGMSAIALGVALAIGLVAVLRIGVAVAPLSARPSKRVPAAAHLPWLQRADWAARRIEDRATLAPALFMGIWCLGWWAVLATQWLVAGDRIAALISRNGSDAAAYGVLLLGGVAGLLVLLHLVRAWWRYGHATLLLDTLPGVPGGRFRGTVQLRLPRRPEQPVEASLVCERVQMLSRRGAAGRSERIETTQERWSAETRLAPLTLRFGADGVLLVPVDFSLPLHEPESAMRPDGNGVRWVVRVQGQRTADRRFSFAFEVPVYRQR